MLLNPDSLQRRSLARNEVLFRQGDKATAIYWVETGQLRLERTTFDGRSLVLNTTPAGNFFVEAALFSDTFHCDAIATEPSQVRVYPKAALLQALHTEPESALSFLSHLAHQVVELRQRLELMKVRSAKARVMLYLQLNAGPDGSVNPHGQLQDIAAHLGLSRESLYRTLAGLEQAGVIQRAGTRILIKKLLGA